MAIDIENLLKEMLSAGGKIAAKGWNEIAPYAEKEFRQILDNIAQIEKLKLEGKIAESKAKRMLSIQQNASKSVLIAIDGMKDIAIDDFMADVLKSIKTPVNQILGWTIL